MPVWIWLIVLTAVLVIIAQYVTEGMIRMFFYVLALVTAVAAVWRLIGG